MKRSLAILLIAFALPALAATTATVTDQPYELRRLSNGALLASDLPSKQACVDAAKARGKTLNYTCRLNSTVVVTVTTTPPPVPVDCAVSAWSAWSACANSTQTRSRSVVTQPANGGAACPVLTDSQACTVEPPPVDPPSNGVTYTDLASAPACAKVTTYDAKSRAVISISDPATAGVPVIAGRCLEATPSTFNQSFWASVKPGDVVTLHAGTYTQTFGEGTWYFGQGETYKKGTAAQPIAVVAAPGEAVTFKPSSRPALIFGNGDRATEHAEYLTFAGINIVAGEACISGGGNTTDPSGGPDETGGRYIRIVGVNCTITNTSSNTMTGLLDLQADDWKVLGNTFVDPVNRIVINNNHGVYVQGGADDVEVAYNVFRLHVGHVIQNHQDGTPKLYERLSIHDNSIIGDGYGAMRGIGVINVADASTISIARNRISHQGQGGWGCFNLYRGQISVTDNECTDSQGGLNLNGQYGGTRKGTASGNKVCPVSGYPRNTFENGASASQLTETNVKACP
jgi:thrombospondin type 1 repeat protein